jgi:twitching motility protein PilU
LQLSLNLRAIVSQRLLPAVNGGRVAAIEILLDTPRMKDLIKKGEIDTLKEAMEQGIREGCQTFDQALLVLYQAGKITIAEALANADSANNLRLKIKMAGLITDEPADGTPQANPEAGAEIKTDGAGVSNVFRLQGR